MNMRLRTKQVFITVCTDFTDTVCGKVIIQRPGLKFRFLNLRGTEASTQFPQRHRGQHMVKHTITFIEILGHHSQLAGHGGNGRRGRRVI